MRQLLNTTTALITSLALVAPGPALAQDLAESELACQDGTKVPCMPGQEPLDANGVPVPDTTMTEEQQAAAKAAAAKAAEDAAAAEAAAAAQKAADDAAAAKAAEDAAAAAAAQKAAEDAAAAKAAEDAAAAQKAADDAAAAAAAEDAAAAQKAADDAAAAKAAEDAAAQKAADDAAAAEAAAAAKAAEDAAAAAAAQKAADDAAAAAKAAEEAAAAEAAAAAKAAEDAAAAEAQKAADDAAAAQKAAEDAAAAEAAAAAEKAAADQAAKDAASLPTPEDVAKALAEQANVPAEGVAVVPDLPVQPDATTGDAPVAEAATLPVEGTATDATDAPPADVTVTEETVAPDAVRTSDQDFANKVNEVSPAAEAAAAALAAAAAAAAGTPAPAPAPGPATAAAPTAEKKDRLTDAEKVLLLGLGAVAVGAILSNNRKVQLNSGDRVVVMRDDGTQQVIKDDDALLRRPGDRVRTERFGDGSTRTTVLREDGSRVVTIRDAEFRVLRRVHIAENGLETILIDDTVSYEPVVIRDLPKPRRHPVIADISDEDVLRAALEDQRAFERRFSLSQVRNIREVRDLVPVIDLNAITFASGSAAITPDQAQTLSGLGRYIRDIVNENPREVFLIEGHTDAVGNAAYNLALSDRRAESVALALTEYFRVPPENLVVQGYGEEFLKIDTPLSERLNRRASVRRITDLLRQAAAE